MLAAKMRFSLSLCGLLVMAACAYADNQVTEILDHLSVAKETIMELLKAEKPVDTPDSEADLEFNKWYFQLQKLVNETNCEYVEGWTPLQTLKVDRILEEYYDYLRKRTQLNNHLVQTIDLINQWKVSNSLSIFFKVVLRGQQRLLQDALDNGNLQQKDNALDNLEAIIIDNIKNSKQVPDEETAVTMSISKFIDILRRYAALEAQGKITT